MRITEKELERITDFQKRYNLENKTTDEIVTNYFIRCDNCDELIPEIYSKDILDDNKDLVENGDRGELVGKLNKSFGR